jgi:putative DNA primase/helicase
MTALDRLTDALRDRDCKPRPSTGGQWSARCPAHEDRAPSLSLRQIEGQALVHCHAGCTTVDVLAALELGLGDLYDEPRGAAYRYDDGRVVHRSPDKRFHQSGRTQGGASLYRLGKVTAAVAAGQTVYLCEGEKDVHALESVGLVATTSPMGSANWGKVDPSPLAKATVVLVADNDEPGRRYATEAKASLHQLGATVTVVTAKAGKDAADHIAAGYGPDEFVPVLLPTQPVHTAPSPWDPVPPTPLSKTPTPPPFPVEALGTWTADMVEAVAEATQTDAGMAGTLVLGALATAAGGRAEVEVRAGWREPTNLYVVAAAAPGTRKSAVFREIMDPLRAAERNLVDAASASVFEAATQREVARHAAEAATRKAGAADRAQRDALLSEAITAREMAEAITVPPMPRLLADDVTPEAMTSLLAEHGGRLAVISAEGGIFDVLAGRYSKSPNIDAALKGHAGDTLRVDRKGRPPEYVERPALTMALTVQPSVLEGIGRIGEFSGRGLLARFLYALPTSTVGRRKVGAAPVPEDVRQQYTDRLRGLAETAAPWVDPMVLTLSPAAAELHLQAEHRLEPRLGPGGDLGGIVEWASKLLGAAARIAGLLHLAEHGAAGVRQPVSENTMRAALTIGDYFTAHAEAVFDLMGADHSLDAARTVLAHLHAREVTTTTVRALHVALPRSRFPKAADVADAMEVLGEYGWVARLPQPEHTGPGRPPSPSYRVHPPITATQSTQSTKTLLPVGSVDSVDSVATDPHRRGAA